MTLLEAQIELNRLLAELRQCRKCAKAGYFIGSTPVFSGPASAQVMVVGQAPAQVEAGKNGVPFGLRRRGRRSLLWEWLEQAGWPETKFRASHYLADPPVLVNKQSMPEKVKAQAYGEIAERMLVKGRREGLLPRLIEDIEKNLTDGEFHREALGAVAAAMACDPVQSAGALVDRTGASA